MNKQVVVAGIGAAIALGLAVMVLASSWKSLPPVPAVYPAHGKLVFKNGEPVRLAIMNLSPKEQGKGHECEARIGPDGKFELRSFSNTGNDGAVPGEYKVSLEPFYGPAFPPNATKNVKPSKIPTKYLDSKTSGITIVIKPEDNDLGTIRLD